VTLLLRRSVNVNHQKSSALINGCGFSIPVGVVEDIRVSDDALIFGGLTNELDNTTTVVSDVILWIRISW
jgi:hypothetical protein